jgi:hypothetical protein
MDKKKLLQQLQKEQKDLGQKIMALSNSLYFNEDMPAKDLVREQRQAMDNYFEALEARITDLEYDILMDESLDPEARKAFDEAEENAKKKKAEPNFLDGMFNDLNSDLDEMLEDLRKRCHNLVGDKHSNVTKLENLEGREIINTNPPRCHECENDGTGCVKIILPGNQHLCAK